MAIGVKTILEPVFIAEGCDDSEYLVVGLNLDKFKLRIICGYAPQETAPTEKKIKFWGDIDHQVDDADLNGAAVVIQMDSNSWLGDELIKGDPNKINNNGKRVEDFMKRNPNIHLINGTDKCKGTITRQRQTVTRKEESVLDLFLVSKSLEPFIKEMVIDHERKFPLVTKANKSSDHFTTFLDLSVSFTPVPEDRKEMFNYRNIDCQKTFKENTENNENLTKCFETAESIENQCKIWRKNLDKSFYNSFDKIRINNKVKVTEETLLLEEKIKLINEKKKGGDNEEELDAKIEKINKKLIELTSKKNRDKVINNFQTLDGSFGNSFNIGVWKLKKKIFPKHQSQVPVAKLNANGRLATSKEEIKNLYLDTFIFRLRERPIKKEFKDIQTLTEDLCKLRLENTINNKTEEWNMNDLNSAPKNRKKDKARDPEGLANDLFMPNVAGTDLKKSLLSMFNRLKDETFIPEFMRLKNISTIHKNKGSKNSLKNDRGVIMGSVFNTILMNLVYLDQYDTIDENMSYSNMGSRKNKGTRIQNFIINAVLNEAAQSRNINLEVLVLDYQECYDSLYLSSCVNDLYDSGVKDNQLNLIHKANSSAMIGVNTPVGLTERREVKDSILQGEKMGPFICSNSVDKIGKKCLDGKQYLYYYRGEVGLPPLGLVDDLVAIAECGVKAVEMIAFLNVQTNIKKLRFGTDKCYKLHIGKDKSLCQDLFIDKWKLEPKKDILTSVCDYEDIEDDEVQMKKTNDTKYLGETISVDSSNTKNITERVRRGINAGKTIIQILDENTFGKYETEVFLVLRAALMLSTMLTNAECWYNLTIKNIENLEAADERIIREKYSLHSKTSKIFLYLELGIVPLRFLIMSRRILFLWWIMQEPEESIIYQVLKIQRERPVKGDWCTMVQKDIEILDINLTFEEIKNVTKQELKNFLRKQIEQKAFEYLIKIKENQSKMTDLKYKKLETQEYLKPKTGLTKTEVSGIMMCRSRMVPVKSNFKSAHNAADMKCRACRDINTVESQFHLIVCGKLNPNSMTTNVQENYEDLYSDNTERIVLIARKICNQNRILQALLSAPGELQDNLLDASTIL